MIFLYHLRDATTNEICYVGVTSRPTRRVREHLRQASKSGSRIIKSCYFSWCKDTLEPIIDVIGFYKTRSDAFEAEVEEIRKQWDSGEPLFNIDHVPDAEEVESRSQSSEWYKLFQESLK